MPTYSPDDDNYKERVFQNQRPEDPQFEPNEALYRRYREKDLVNGMPTPLSGFKFYETDGHSVNRGKYSEPQDVLEPECCEGHFRPDHVVLEFFVHHVPKEIAASDGSGRVYRFCLKHVPHITCYGHSEIWCNQHGNVDQPYEKPQKHVRDLFIASLLSKGPSLRTFQPLESNPKPGPTAANGAAF